MSTFSKIVGVSLLVILGTALWMKACAAPALQQEYPVVIATAPPRPDSLDKWIQKLVMAESGGRENIVIVDSNGHKSYGCLQYQKATWDRFTKKYGVTGKIMDCKAQRMLTRRIIESEPNGYRHWLNSSKKIGKPPL